MPLFTDDWIIDTADVGATVSVIHNTSDPVAGDRCLRISITTGGGAGTKGAGAVFLDTTNHTRGFTMGRIRTLIRVDQEVDHAGIYAMASDAVGVAGVGTAYTFGPMGEDNELTLLKVNAGLYDATPQIINATGVELGEAPTAIKAIELIWRADFDIFGGTQLICKAGDEIDFSDLEIIYSGVDEDEPLTSTACEGLYAVRSGLVMVGQASFDNTTVYQTTIV